MYSPRPMLDRSEENSTSGSDYGALRDEDLDNELKEYRKKQ